MIRSTEVVVYQRGVIEDRDAETGEVPEALFNSRVCVNGREIPVTDIVISAKGGDFTTAKICLAPGVIRFVTLTAEEWKARDLSTDA